MGKGQPGCNGQVPAQLRQTLGRGQGGGEGQGGWPHPLLSLGTRCMRCWEFAPFHQRGKPGKPHPRPKLEILLTCLLASSRFTFNITVFSKMGITVVFSDFLFI